MDDILAALTEAYSNLTLHCGVSSLMHYVPALRRRPGFKELHRENYEISYHLTTAIGSARLILGGSREPGYFALVVNCEREALEHQQRAMAAFRRLAEGAPAEVRPLLEQLQGLLQATMGSIQRAIGITTAVFGPETMARLVEWSRQTQE